MSISKHRPLVLGAALALTLLPLAAQAQRRSPLEDAPAIRKRLELRTARLEVGAGVSSTLNQDFFHTLFVTGKIGFHLNDWLSIAGFVGGPIAALNTGYQDRVVETLPTAPTGIDREQTKNAATASMEKISLALGAQLEFTPFTGKFSMFGALFAHYDFYIFLGGGALSVKPNDPNVRSCDSATPGDDIAKRSCGTTGFAPGGNVGVGLHTYFTDWLALNVELRDMITRLNMAGRDVNGDGVANTDDLSWTNTYMLGANLTFYLPPTAAISN